MHRFGNAFKKMLRNVFRSEALWIVVGFMAMFGGLGHLISWLIGLTLDG